MSKLNSIVLWSMIAAALFLTCCHKSASSDRADPGTGTDLDSDTDSDTDNDAPDFTDIEPPAPSGCEWTTLSGRFEDVAVLPGGDVMVVGPNGAALIFEDGAPSATETRTLGNLNAVWSDGAGTVLAAGDSAPFLRYDDAGWQAVADISAKTIHDVWGTGADDAFAVGHWGQILHYDGDDLIESEVDTTANLVSVHGTAADDVWAIGQTGTVLRFDGDAWAVEFELEGMLRDIYVAAPDDVFVVRSDAVLHYDGETWVGMEGATGGFAGTIWGDGPNNVWVGGQDGDVRRFDGFAWSPLPIPGAGRIEAITGDGSGTVHAVTWDGLFRYDGEGWVEVHRRVGDHLRGAWFGADGVGFAVGENGAIARCDELGCSPEESPVTSYLNAAWGSGPDDVHAGGFDGEMLHYDGVTWSQSSQIEDGEIYAIWGSGPADVYAAVGYEDGLWRFDGESWSAVPASLGTAYLDVWGTTEGEVFAIGSSCAFLTFDGASWTSTLLGMDFYECPMHIWGFAADDIYGVNYDGFIGHYDGVTWTDFETGWGPWASDLAGNQAGDLFVPMEHCGDESCFWYFDHFHQGFWSEIKLSSPIRGLSTTGGDRMLAVGDYGTVMLNRCD